MKARRIRAIEIELAAGVKAVLVQHGLEWNRLTEFRCVSPAGFKDQVVIATPAGEGGPFTQVFKDVFGLVDDMAIVMASPAIGEALRAIKGEAAPA